MPDLLWHLEFTKTAAADLDRLDASVRKRILQKIVWLQGAIDHIVPQPLTDSYRGYFKLRVGDWRIVYDIEAEKQLITIYLIDRRDKIYKRL